MTVAAPKTRNWEETFTSWAKPPGSAEQQRIENTVRAIRKAVSADDELSSSTNVRVVGSYNNRVNVRRESDVDLCVLYTGNAFTSKIPDDMTEADFDIGPSDYSYASFKSKLEKVLRSHFESENVFRGDKTFHVNSNTYRVDADVTPVLEHRRYRASGAHKSGVVLWTDSGNRIVNWHDQHYENGVSKNAESGMRYKGMVRIFKKLWRELLDGGDETATEMSGFVCECLVWNAPSECYSGDTWFEHVQEVFRYLWLNTGSDQSCNEWGEVSDLKYLLRPISMRVRVNEFIWNAWQYVLSSDN